MNKKVIKKTNTLPIITAALLIMVNVIVLTGVSYNRSGETRSALQLTERELSLPYRSYRQKENSGLALNLNWRVVTEEPFKNSYNKYSQKRFGTPNWLTDDKLKELGLYIDNTKYNINDLLFDNRNLQTQEIIVVLEYNGQAFQTLLNNADKHIKILRNQVKNNPHDTDLVKQLKRDEASLTKLKTSESRLIAIDAGHNLQTLKESYADSSQYLLMRGEIKRYWIDKKLTGKLNSLFISNIHVPLPYSNEINELTNHETMDKNKKRNNGKPRYQLELNVGERLEPWIGKVAGL